VILVGGLQFLTIVLSSGNQMLYGLMVKKQETRNRLAAIRRARRSPQATAEQQRRASLAGNGAKWRATNFKQVAQAIAKWA
jgi:hypothetical protein